MAALSKILLSLIIVFGGILTIAAQSSALIDIGGYRLDVVRAGAGGPPIVLVAGLGNDLEEWKPVLPALAELSTVISYSRSGLV